MMRYKQIFLNVIGIDRDRSDREELQCSEPFPTVNAETKVKYNMYVLIAVKKLSLKKNNALCLTLYIRYQRAGLSYASLTNP